MVKTLESLSIDERNDAIPLIRLQLHQSETSAPVFTIVPEQGQRFGLIVSKLEKQDGIKGYKLKRGDIFKIGKTKVYVKDICKPSMAFYEDSCLTDRPKAEEGFSE